MLLSSVIKRGLHRDIVSDPETHAWVLNLYLNGERYPQRVDDYFPLTDDAALSARMSQHVREEERHVALYSKAIHKLGHQVHEVPLSEVFNQVVRSHTPVDFAIAVDDEAELKIEKLAHFLAHVHFIEKRVLRSLDYHVDACSRAEEPYVGKAVAAVHGDEAAHVVYTREAVLNLLSHKRAMQVMALHEMAERSASIEFSARHLRYLVTHHTRRFPRRSRLLYQLCAGFLSKGIRAT